MERLRCYRFSSWEPAGNLSFNCSMKSWQSGLLWRPKGCSCKDQCGLHPTRLKNEGSQGTIQCSSKDTEVLVWYPEPQLNIRMCMCVHACSRMRILSLTHTYTHSTAHGIHTHMHTCTLCILRGSEWSNNGYLTLHGARILYLLSPRG